MTQTAKSAAILVVGGGIAGIEAALDAAAAGFKVYLVERESALGARMAALDGTAPSGDCAACMLSVRTAEVAGNSDIRVFMPAEVKSVEGEAGSFRVTITRHIPPADVPECPPGGEAGSVGDAEAADSDDGECQSGGEVAADAVECPPGGEAGSVGDAEAADSDDGECQSGAEATTDAVECSPGGEATAVGEGKAAESDDSQRDETVDAGAIILASGGRGYDASRAGEYGYGRSKNVLTSIEYERMLSASGPTGGRVERPSDGKPPGRVAFIQCVGSRSVTVGANPWCSTVCCMYTAKEAAVTRQRAPETEITVFHADIRAHGKGCERYRDAAEKEHGVRYVRSLPSAVREIKRTGNLSLRYVDEKSAAHEEEFDLVVLAVGLESAADAAETAAALGINVDENGFPSVAESSPVDTSRAGVFAAGAAVEPRDIAESVASASAAAARAGELLAALRGAPASVRVPQGPAGVEGREAVACAGHCGDGAKGINNAEGLSNEGLLAELARVGNAIERRALVIGGGAAGMTAALSLARQGFGVTLVEKEESLGGNLKGLYRSVRGLDLRAYLSGVVGQVGAEPMVEVLTDSALVRQSGRAGNFESAVNTPGGMHTVRHGVTVVATGAAAYRPTEYCYGETPRVITQRELESRLAEGGLSEILPPGHAVVMIQCVGSRDEKRPYCSRVCCSQAVKNAVEIKRLSPETPVFVLYRDVRTYGFKEELYRRARAAGVLFIRYTPQAKPEVAPDGEGLRVRVFDNDLQEEVTLDAGAVVLSAGIVPNTDADELSRLLKLPVTEDGFFLEAHVNLRPVDSALPGVYICGLAHGPKLFDESVLQAIAAAGRAATILAYRDMVAAGPGPS